MLFGLSIIRLCHKIEKYPEILLMCPNFNFYLNSAWNSKSKILPFRKIGWNQNAEYKNQNFCTCSTNFDEETKTTENLSIYILLLGVDWIFIILRYFLLSFCRIHTKHSACTEKIGNIENNLAFRMLTIATLFKLLHWVLPKNPCFTHNDDAWLISNVCIQNI